MTAVEWLTEKLRIEFGFAFSNNILEQAKEMEKQDKHSEYMRGWKDGYSKQELKSE
jgi:hypothetical protein